STWRMAPVTYATGPPREVRQSIRDLLERLPQSAAFVSSADGEVLAWNPLAAALMEDFSALPPRERNLLRRAFLTSHADGNLYGVSDRETFVRSATSRLRTAAARYPHDPRIAQLVADLLAGSEEFARIWADGEMRIETVQRKTFRHPMVGPVTVSCDVLDITDSDQQVVILTPDPGSPSDEALRLLGVIGTQRMDVTTWAQAVLGPGRPGGQAVREVRTGRPTARRARRGARPRQARRRAATPGAARGRRRAP